MQKVTINVPDGYEVQVVRKEEKKEEPVIRTYQDLINSCTTIEGLYIDSESSILPTKRLVHLNNRCIASSEKVARSMLATAMISQLMPYYGGAISDEAWNNSDCDKFVIDRYDEHIECHSYNEVYRFLAFHTEKQRDEFLKYNEQLVKDYLMID